MVNVSRHTGRGNSRYYTVDGDPSVEGKRFESVTTITNVLDKPALIGWAESMGISAMDSLVRDTIAKFREQTGAELRADILLDQLPMLMVQAEGASRRKKEDAADIGTETHALIEQYLDGGKPNIPVHLDQVMDNFKAFWDNSNLEIVEAEYMVYSATHGYGGTIDFIARNILTGQRVILDWKTSNGLYKETTLQLAAYGAADAEMRRGPGEKLWDMGLMAVRLGKDYAAFEVKEVTNPAEAFAGFVACMGIRQWIKDMRETEWKK